MGSWYEKETKMVMLSRENGPVLGIDFDNTLIDYRAVIHAVALQKRLIPPTFPQQKKAIRDYIKNLPRGEIEWQKIQALVYGEKIAEATLMEGVADFFIACKKRHFPIYVISHKTEYSNLFQGDKEAVNFRTVAVRWMEKQQFFTRFGLFQKNIYFESTREEKISRIAQLGCTHFIDDLEEVFLEKGFPQGVKKILYSPEKGEKLEKDATQGIMPKNNWEEIYAYLF